MGFVQGLIGVLTTGIYTPMTVEVWCVAAAAPTTIEVRPDREMVVGWLTRYPNLEQLAHAESRRLSSEIASLPSSIR